MEKVIESVPSSLRNELSKKLIDIVLGTQDKNAISTDLAKKIIYLWRQDQLTSPVGLESLFEASFKVDSSSTFMVLDQLGLNKVSIAFHKIIKD
ncbi:hypothetical protein JW865_04225 [Candidatus Bathyarchaeota archaeon]|nr:hypothetical protein [Candidatus Bathyarchaeota archaeon]